MKKDYKNTIRNLESLLYSIKDIELKKLEDCPMQYVSVQNQYNDILDLLFKLEWVLPKIDIDKLYDDEMRITNCFDEEPEELEEEVEHIDVEPEDIESISLLSVGEAKELPQDIRACGKYWWLQSPGYFSHYAAGVDRDGTVNSSGYGVDYGDIAVRPVLYTNLISSHLKLSDVYNFLGEDWYYIGEGRFLIKDNISKHRFNNDPYYDDYKNHKISWKKYLNLCEKVQLNNYEKSEIKEYLENWLKEKENEKGL